MISWWLCLLREPGSDQLVVLFSDVCSHCGDPPAPTDGAPVA